MKCALSEPRPNLYLGALSDALVVQTRPRERAACSDVRPAGAMELSRFLSYSILVDEIGKIGRLAWSPATQHERNIATCRKVRATFGPAFIAC